MATDEQAVETPERLAGWYDNPDGPGLRYWDGGTWTNSYHPGHGPAGATNQDVLWGLALGFGVAGGVIGLLTIPPIAFYWPLGLGAAGLALGVAAMTTKGEDKTPWYAFVAVIGSLLALALGIDAYGEFQDASEELRNLDNLIP